MAIEWIAIAATVKPYVKDYIADRAKKIAEERADGILAGLYRKVVPDEKLVKANESFVSRFGKELDSAVDLATLNIDVYHAALKQFLCNPSVQDALLAPLDDESGLDWK